MAYLRINEGSPTLGWYGCGSGCGCTECRRASGGGRGLGERYIEEEEEEESPTPPPRPGANAPAPASRPSGDLSGWSGFGWMPNLGQGLAIGEPAGSTTPAFRFPACAPGCAPHAANQCRNILRRAIRDAISLADNAAAKLKARDGEALRLFRFFFGDPGPVSWANNKPALDLVADRFLAVANGFRKRVPHFRCAIVGLGAEDCGATTNAFTVPRRDPTATIPLPRNTIILCPPFWAMASHLRAGVLLHEMLHLLFWEFFGHQVNLPRPGDPAERRRDNARCFEAFALRVAGHGADPHDVRCCRQPASPGC